MGHTLAVLCVILGALLLVPVLGAVLCVRIRSDWYDRHPYAFIMMVLTVGAVRRWYSIPGFFTAGSLLLAYGVAALAHASLSATLSAVGIALVSSILLWRWIYVRTLTRRE